MPSCDTYEQNDYLRLLLQGPPGSTKTSLGLQFPKPWIFDLDHNLGGPLRYARNHNLPLPVGYDFVDVDEKGAPVPAVNRWAQLDKKLMAVQADPNVETIIFDSGTIMADMLVTETLRQQNKTSVSEYKDGRQFWGFYAVAGKQLMTRIVNMRKNIVMNIHEKLNTDSEGKVVWPVSLTWQGQVGDMIGLFFTDVWRIQLEQKVGTGITGRPAEFEQIIYTMPTYQYALKNSLELPPKFKFDWNLIQSKLRPSLVAGGAK